MRIPEKSDLPLKAKTQEIEMGPDLFEKFHKSFLSQDDKNIPATYGCVALSGVFEIVNSLKVDWTKLLHGSQSFEYLSWPQFPVKCQAQASLIDCKIRAGLVWLQFETMLTEKKSGNAFLKSKTLIMVKEK